MDAAVSCAICTEHNARAPAAIAFRMQREHAPDATPPYVRCCHGHDGQGAVAAALMRSHLAPAAVYRRSLTEAAGDTETIRACMQHNLIHIRPSDVVSSFRAGRRTHGHRAVGPVPSACRA